MTATLDHARPDLLAGPASRSWFAALPPAKRAAIRELYRLEPSRNLVVLAFVALWLGAAALVLEYPAWPVRFAGYVVMGAALHALGILMHEAVHGNLFRHRTLDRWSAFLLGAPVLVSGAAYKVTHLLHHRYNRGERDPDEFSNYIRDRRLLSFAFYGWGLVGMLVFLAHVPFNALRRGGPRERVAVVTEYALLAALYAGAVLAAARLDALDALVRAWLVPLGLSFLIVNLRGWSEHMLTEPGHPLTQTRTVTSNRLVRFLLCNLNYHLEHHLFPAVPWYNLPRVHALLQDDYRQAGAFVYRSYVKFLWDAVRTGIHGRAPASGQEGGRSTETVEREARLVRPGPSRIALVAYAPIVAGFVAWNARAGRLGGWEWVLEVAGGLALWTLLEYLFHRFLFHIVPSSPWLVERQQHLQHHRTPLEPAYFVVPLSLSFPIAFGTWGLLRLALGSWDRAALVTTGLILGYVAYELVHYSVHQRTGGGRLLRFWRRHHFYHHYKDDHRCYGFTTPLWDLVFGTMPERRKTGGGRPPPRLAAP